MNIGLIGTSHARTPVKTMEALYFNSENQDQLFMDCQNSPLKGLVMLMTCNRVEWYFEAENLDAGFDWLITYISTLKELPRDNVQDLLFRRPESEAIIHLFQVTCGLKSMVIGENEILTQVKQAYESSVTKKTTTKVLNKLFQSAIATGKRVRSETEISQGAYSISSIAIEAIRETRLDYFGLSILIIGTGVMGQRALKKLCAISHPDITLVNRTDTKAQVLAEEEHVAYIPFETLSSRIRDFDIVICTTNTKKPIIGPDLVRSEQEQLLVDLGVPRNIDPQVLELPHISVLTVDSLKDVANRNIKRRQSELEAVTHIISEDMLKLDHWYEMSLSCPS